MQAVLVYLEWFRRNSLKCVSQPKIAKNSLKTPIIGVQGRSRSSMLVPLESPWAVLVVISSKSVSICNRSHARRVNSGKIISKGVNLFDALVRGESPHPVAPNCISQETRDSSLSYGENPESLSHVGLNRYRVVTVGRTDRQTDGQTEFPSLIRDLSSTCRYSCGA